MRKCQLSPFLSLRVVTLRAREESRIAPAVPPVSAHQCHLAVLISAHQCHIVPTSAHQCHISVPI
ncbi:unnamed protein product [Staurois parvus]|uniref:Uncharacterized protein n=1 Tax=Staurois parvus TaxID=386267 RepID=A0ABN9CJE1_9NEOB|nr:unnamed protein product [Staurois parvus]